MTLVVVLDVNVIVSGLDPKGRGAPGEIVSLWGRGFFQVALSEHILTHVRMTYRKPYFQRVLTEDDLNRNLASARRTSMLVEPALDVRGVAEDEEDDLVLATAVAADAEFLVTGDKYMQSIGEFRGIRIVSPRDFLDMMLERP